MSDKLFRGITIILTVFTVFLLIRAVLEINDSVYRAEYSEDSMLYAIQSGFYQELPEKRTTNEARNVKATEGMLECYAVADYYEAAVLYFGARQNADTQMEDSAREVMQDAVSRMGALSYCAQEINQQFENYFAVH